MAEAWKKFYEAPAAPFSWEPNEADVQGSTPGRSVRVRCAMRAAVFATFTSIWRREAPGVWRIIFDKGNDVCQKCAPISDKGALLAASWWRIALQRGHAARSSAFDRPFAHQSRVVSA